MATSQPGTLHVVLRQVSAFEPSKPLARSLNINTLLWVGGLGDTQGSVSYPFVLAQSLPPTWSLMTCALSSSGGAWGMKTLQTDVADLKRIVEYVRERRPGGKVVIMGHSTGCQDCMEYIVKGGGAAEGIILQAPVSDREALDHALPQAHKHAADQLALKMCREGNGKDAMPNRMTGPVFGSTAISAKRWVDISSPGPDHSGADDYFSSDFSVERLKTTFGKFSSSTPLLILYSGADESISDSLDKESLVNTWTKIVKESGGVVDEVNGGVIPGASHNLNGNDESVVQDLVRRVLGFVSTISGIDAAASTTG